MAFFFPGPEHIFRLAGYTRAELLGAFRPDRDSVRFALRTTAASLLALAIGTWLGFQEAYWAAVTTWVLAIPGRGMVLSKALYRSLGTVAGAIAALAVLPLAGHPVPYILALSVWVGACAVVASLFRRFQAYAAQLAGYTATIVAVVALQDPTGPTIGLSLERVLLVLTGIASSSLLAWLFAKPIAEEDLRREARRWAARSAQWASALLARADCPEDDGSPNQDLWLGLSEFDSTCAYAAFESPVIRHRLAAIRRLTAANVSLVSAARMLRRHRSRAAVVARQGAAVQLATAALLFGGGRVPAAEIAAIRAAALSSPGDAEAALDNGLEAAGIAERLLDLADRLERIARDLDFLQGEPSRRPPPLAIHRDWQTSLGIGLRSGLGTLAIGLLWFCSNWSGGGYAFVFTAVACTLFGVLPRPATGLERFALGVGATVVFYLVWSAVPGTGALGPLGSLVMVVLGTFVGALALAKRFVPAMDFNANVTALMLGAGPALVRFPAAAAAGSGLLIGIVVAYAAFALPPSGAAWRRRRLDRALSTRLNRLAEGRWQPQPHKWETGTYDLLGQFALTDIRPGHSADAMRQGLRVLDVGLEIIKLRAILGSATTPATVGTIVAQALAIVAAASPDSPGAASAILADKAQALLAVPAHQDGDAGRTAARAATAIATIARCFLDRDDGLPSGAL